MKKILLLLALSFTGAASAQNFINGDLAGTYTANSALPTGWQNVPFGDINCLAAGTSEATPDLTDINGPDSFNGLSGTPFSGNTFVSGLFETNGGPAYYHEGIMQTLTGLTPNLMYRISFYQAVVKQINAIDHSGSWSVYIDNTLTGTSAPTRDTSNYKTLALKWENRSIVFQAQNSSHLIKFLPMDDDPNHNTSMTDTLGGIRMGIDLISLELATGVFSPASEEKLFSLYPNPAKNLLTISSPQKGTFEILNVDGLVLMQVETEPGETRINIEELPPAIYIIRNNSTDRISHQRFVKK